MSKIAIVYWSGTGNTEAMADLVAQGVRAKGSDADLINATDFGPERLDEYDAYAFGCPAMGDEELEDTEFLPMYDAVEPLLEGKRVALFGSYDWNDGEWMELWEQRAEPFIICRAEKGNPWRTQSNNAKKERSLKTRSCSARSILLPTRAPKGAQCARWATSLA